MKVKQTGLALMAALTVSFAGSTALAAENIDAPFTLAQTTTIERERDILPDNTPEGGDVEIKTRDGLTTTELEIDEDGTVDDNDTEYAGFSLMTWVLFGLVALALVGFFMSRRGRVHSV